jgi:hypothetical protein
MEQPCTQHESQIEVLDLLELNLCLVLRVVFLDRRDVGGTLVDRDLRRCAMLTYGLA